MILCIETSGKNCSVAIHDEGNLVASASHYDENYSHAEKLHPLIEECLLKASITKEELKAVAVSKGPGSYTGLRIGVASAKGICYALGIPMIAIETPRILAAIGASTYPEGEVFVTLTDARRMEVYTASYNSEGAVLSPTEAKVIDESSFSDLHDVYTVFTGDGVEKCAEILARDGWTFDGILPNAEAMVALSQEAFKKQQFEDVAYFEPFYLKDFIAGKPKDLLKRLRK